MKEKGRLLVNSNSDAQQSGHWACVKAVGHEGTPLGMSGGRWV